LVPMDDCIFFGFIRGAQDRLRKFVWRGARVWFSSLLVDREVVDLDSSLVVVGSVGDGVGTGAWEATVVVNRTGPITTDGDVDDNAVIAEGFGNITTLVGPVRNGDSPSFRVGIFVLNILWDLVTFEPPERDLSFVPEHSDDTTTSQIERSTSASLEICNGATGVVTVRALAIETKGVSEVTLWLRAVFVPVLGGGIGI